MDCSIIICTRNRAPMLEATLRAFGTVKVPSDWRVEILIADNGSTDHTADVVKAAKHSGMEIRRVYEPRPGKSRAQNAALAEARGGVLLFTDDDVEPADNWLERMARPLLERRCDAVAGRILLAEDLRRPWFTAMHGVWMAEARELASDAPELIGASMGIHRSVFDRIDVFDEELGPGASGFGEETLVWMQMKEAGMRIRPVNDSFVIHRPDISRLLRSSWLETAVRRGKTIAYVQHHWEHDQTRCPGLLALWTRAKLVLRSLIQRPSRLDAEGCPAWEISYVTRIAGLKALMDESRKPRNYELRALRRKVS